VGNIALVKDAVLPRVLIWERSLRDRAPGATQNIAGYFLLTLGHCNMCYVGSSTTKAMKAWTGKKQ
jgi:hypothetical protein